MVGKLKLELKNGRILFYDFRKSGIEKKDLPWWKQIIGTFADDPAHEEAMRLGREYRLAQREDYDTDEENK